MARSNNPLEMARLVVRIRMPAPECFAAGDDRMKDDQ